nr:hypothetical protein [Tanacetum cinerariifolium]
FDEVAIYGIHVPPKPGLSVVDCTTIGTLRTDKAIIDGDNSQVPSLGVESICFDIILFSRVFSKKLHTVKCIPPRWRDPVKRLRLVSDRLADLTHSFSGVKKSDKHDEANVIQCKRKLGDGDFTAAIMVLTSSDLVLNMIRSFPKGTSCGQDGLKAQHLMDILGGAASVVADDLLGSITSVVNLFLSGKCPSKLREYIVSALLTPLVKPGGGIRPISVGTVWRRLVSKVASSSNGISMNTYLQDFQFGVGIPGSCEDVLHSVNRLVESKGNEWRLATLLIKLGGLGILSVGDIIQYAFLVSRLQTNDLQAKILKDCEVGVKFRHNLVRDILGDICFKVGIMVRNEAPMGFLSHDGKDLRPADLLLFIWLQGKDACMDVTGISPFAGMGANSWAPVVALHNAVENKKRKYVSICEDNRYKFIPFAFSTFGEFDMEALDTLSRIKAISISHSNNSKSDDLV